MADSLKLAVICGIGCLVSWSGVLALFDTPWFQAAAFVLYFCWPVIGLLLSMYVCVCAGREIQMGRRRQAVVAMAIVGCATVFGFWMLPAGNNWP